MHIHVVSKSNNAEHTTISLNPAISPLPPSSIRVKPELVSLTSNNLSYARSGHILRWWDTYPVPSNSPAPYNDQSTWGIVPAWGYGIVLESTTSLLPGTRLWGFWPTANTSVDLTVTPGQPDGTWIETSPHRQALMPLYNRYAVAYDQEKDRMAWSTVFNGTWRAGYLLSEYVLNPLQPIHPLGASAGLPWTAEDADVSSAVVIALGASAKTARLFTYNFARRSANLPLGYLLVSSSPEPLISPAASSGFPVRAVSYDELEKSADWLADRKPTKLVIVDFGGRGDSLRRLCELIKHTEGLKTSKRVIIHVGGQQKVYTSEEVQAARDAMVAEGKIQYNTAGVQDTLLQGNIPDDYLNAVNKRWNQWLDERNVAIPDMRLVWGSGVDGPQGIDGGWQRLCHGDVGSEEALVYEL
ncbi:DUF2855 family protein [Aspergillus affinis]|uniref:DUF2855 family protein n=1 Tax=Aspergillus affinis TaxID=1070780 RepID=UPI0022FE8101|nr:uncharacterized protein KD926_005511 [Aspergillus affinis]KAI9042433.1 hypothetical protein KD926_005511 [Aspergillus affinis]